ncbi:EamA/RhaT family transporter [Wenyingzhuangia sp. IMCC45533]
MLYLLLSVLFTSIVFLGLKEFNRFKIDNFQGIVASYFTATFIGYFFGEIQPTYSFLIHKSWVYGALSISLIFISVFNIMAITAQKGGLSIMSVANKMSVVIPIMVGVVFYREGLGFYKVLGILMALLGVWFTSIKKEQQSFSKDLWYLPIIIFVGSGVADTIINHMQTFYVPQNEIGVFSTSLFLFCGLMGLTFHVIKLLRGTLKPSAKSIVGGCILGIPNYFSVYFLLKALSQPNYQTSFIFSVNNVLVVLSSVFLGVLFYKEKLTIRNYLGVLMSVIAIVLLYVAV